MFGGKISKTGKFIEGSHRQHAYSDTSDYEHVISYDGEITTEVEKAIRAAWWAAKCNHGQNGYGQLRWFSGRNIVSIDRERKIIIAQESISLCD